jgi:glutathione S-transferase
MSKPTLVIGNKNYSSWSMRPWLALRWAAIDFDELLIPLGGQGYGQSRIPAVLAHSPSGRVPVLEIGALRVWESLAICEWAAEERPDAGLWPDQRDARAVCRSAACEMHAGFSALRRDFSANIRRRTQVLSYGDDVRADITRIEALWADCRQRFGAGGDYLFGRRTIADAMFAPVCTRFRTYGVALSPLTAAYCATIFADPAFLDWERAAIDEPWTLSQTDSLWGGQSP